MKVGVVGVQEERQVGPMLYWFEVFDGKCVVLCLWDVCCGVLCRVVCRVVSCRDVM